MATIAEIKQVMRSDREKENNICKYELELNISRADSRASCIYEVEPNTCRTESRTRNCDRTSNRKSKNTYGTAATTVALDLGSVFSPTMSSRRSWTSGKKSSATGSSVMKQPVVALSAPEKPYHHSPVQDSKGAVSEAYCPDLQCTPQVGMGKNVAAVQCSGTCGERKRTF